MSMPIEIERAFISSTQVVVSDFHGMKPLGELLTTPP